MTINISEVSPNHFELEGRLELSHIKSIQNKLASLALTKNDCEIDCSKLSYCDSAGIALLINTVAAAKRNKVKVLLTRLTSQMQGLIQLMELNKVFEIEQ